MMGERQNTLAMYTVWVTKCCLTNVVVDSSLTQMTKQIMGGAGRNSGVVTASNCGHANGHGESLSIQSYIRS